jgi:hypothetical protein
MRVKMITGMIVLLLVTAFTFFAPGPEYFAINYETKQCGGYWVGDEFVTYELPPGWYTFEPIMIDFGHRFSVETNVGTCIVNRTDVVYRKTYSNFYEACCAQLGYTYIPENIGIYTITRSNIDNQKAWEEEEKELSARVHALETAERNQIIVKYIFISAIVILPILFVIRLVKKK